MELPRTATNDLRHAPLIGKVFKPLYKNAISSNQNDSAMKYLNIPADSDNEENLLILIHETTKKEE